MPAIAFSDRNLRASDLRVLGVLCSFRNAETGRCDPYVKTIAERAGLSMSATRKALGRLRCENYIVVEEQWNEFTGGQVRNSYVIVDLDGITGKSAGVAVTIEAGSVHDRSEKVPANSTTPTAVPIGPPTHSVEAPLFAGWRPPVTHAGALENRQGNRQAQQTEEHLRVRAISKHEDQNQERHQEQEHEDLNTWRLEQVRQGQSLPPTLSDEELSTKREAQRRTEGAA